MKTRMVYELNFKTNVTGWHNLLFGTKKRAEKDLKGPFAEGSIWGGEIIENTFIITRELF